MTPQSMLPDFDAEIPTFILDIAIIEDFSSILNLRCVAKCPLGGHISYKWHFRSRDLKFVVSPFETFGSIGCPDGDEQEDLKVFADRSVRAGHYYCVVSSSRTNKIAISKIVEVIPLTETPSRIVLTSQPTPSPPPVVENVEEISSDEITVASSSGHTPKRAKMETPQDRWVVSPSTAAESNSVNRQICEWQEGHLEAHLFSSLLQWNDTSAEEHFKRIATTKRGDTLELFRHAVKREAHDDICTNLDILLRAIFAQTAGDFFIDPTCNWLVKRPKYRDCHMDVAVLLTTANNKQIPLLLIEVGTPLERKRAQLHRYYEILYREHFPEVWRDISTGGFPCLGLVLSESSADLHGFVTVEDEALHTVLQKGVCVEDDASLKKLLGFLHFGIWELARQWRKLRYCFEPIDVPIVQIDFECQSVRYLNGKASSQIHKKKSVFVYKFDKKESEADTEKVDLAIKFFTRSDGEAYGTDVHQHLATKNLAPEYLYSGFAFTSKYIAMGYLPAVNWRSLNDRLNDAEPLTPVFAKSVIRKLQATVNALHERNYVHGDLRATNVLVSNDGDVRIVDFNWAGKSDHVYYPESLNPDIDWPGVPKLPIRENHDHYFVAEMIRKIKDKEQI